MPFAFFFALHDTQPNGDVSRAFLLKQAVSVGPISGVRVRIVILPGMHHSGVPRDVVGITGKPTSGAGSGYK